MGTKLIEYQELCRGRVGCYIILSIVTTTFIHSDQGHNSATGKCHSTEIEDYPTEWPVLILNLIPIVNFPRFSRPFRIFLNPCCIFFSSDQNQTTCPSTGDLKATESFKLENIRQSGQFCYWSSTLAVFSPILWRVFRSARSLPA